VFFVGCWSLFYSSIRTFYMLRKQNLANEFYVYVCGYRCVYVCIQFVFAVLEFELRASCLLGMPPFLFALVIFERVLLFRPQSSYFRLPIIAWMSGMCHHTQLFSVEMGSCKLFCPGWPGTTDLGLLHSWDGGIHHHAQIFSVEMGASWTFLPRLV
jgi:hypothetical protein